jgi:hypothetical protein
VSVVDACMTGVPNTVRAGELCFVVGGEQDAVARSVTVHECSGAPEQLVAAWQGAGETVVVEAMPGPVPGVVSRCQPHPRPLAGGCSPTRLSPDLREALALGPLPERVTVITIAAQRFASSAGVSPEVALSAHRVASAILDDWSVPTIAGQSAVAVPAGV